MNARRPDMPTTGSYRALTYLLLLALAITAPLVLLFGALLVQSASVQRVQMESRVSQVCDALVSDIDREFDRDITILHTLATSEALSDEDWPAFYEQAKAGLQGRAYLVLVDAKGRQLVNTYVPYGQQPAVTGDPETLRRILETRKPAVSNLFTSLVVKKPVFNVSIPIVQDNKVRYVMSLGLLPEDVSALLNAQKLGPEWVTLIWDSNGVLLARSQEDSQFVGKHVPKNMREQDQRAVVRTTNLDGVDVLHATARSQLSGWGVGVNVPYSMVTEQMRHSLLLWAGAGLFAIIVAFVAALFFARKVTTSLSVAADAAAAFGRGEAFPLTGSRLKEADAFLVTLKEAQQNARDTQERLSGLIDSAMDAVLAIDAQQQIVLFNPAAEQMFRCRASDAKGSSLERFIPDRFHGAHRRHIEKFGETGVTNRSMSRPGTLWGLREGGEEFPIEATISQVTVGDRKLFTVILRDISERKRAEAELQKERDRLSLALTAGKMGVYEMDLAQNTLWLSPESYSLLGTTYHDFSASPESFVGLVHPQDRDLLLQHIKGTIEAHGTINHEFRVLPPDGRECWVSCQGQVEYNETGRAVRHSGLLVDITSRKQSEQMVRRFERLSAAARLSTAMAHEINNPLAGVVNLVYLAKTVPGTSDAVTELLARAERELERVAHAAQQTLGFYRESNAPERIDIPGLIESVLELHSTKLVSYHISIERVFGECAPIQGVRGEIRQAVSNVIANAIEALAKGGVIVIGVHSVSEKKDAAAEIVIADNGPGIPAGDVDKVFEPFFTTKGTTGMGLGLWVTKDIVERHGGTITVSTHEEGSELRGATVTIRLPRAPRIRRNEAKISVKMPSEEGEPAAQ
ncbi:MAG: ATP-binding protein [Terracidiphilus sp.]